MNRQQYFDRIVGHMRAQGNPWGNYRQRGWYFVKKDDPCIRCAQGVLMDVELSPEGKYYEVYKEYEYTRDEVIFDMVRAMQYIFESQAPITWEQEFLLIAERFDVIVPSVTTEQEDRQRSQENVGL